MFKVLFFLLLSAQIVFATEVTDSNVKALFSKIEEHLENSDWGYCLWPGSISIGQSPDEYFTQMSCNNGSYAIKFDIWLYPHSENTFWAEGYAAVDGSPKWYCLLNGKVSSSSVESSSSCTQID